MSQFQKFKHCLAPFSTPYDLDATLPDPPAGDDHPGLNETNSVALPVYGSNGTISEYYTARETIPTKRLDYDSDATISDPGLEEYGPETASSMKVEEDSDATISDCELEDKYKHVLNMSGPLMLIDPDSEELISIPQTIADAPRGSPSAAAAKSIARTKKGEVHRTHRKMPTPRRCSLCKQKGHTRKVCPTIPCTYKGCNETGHVFTNCRKRLARNHEYKNEWQRVYEWRKRREALNEKND